MTDAKGRLEEGDDVLRRLHDKPLDHPNVQNMRSEILAVIKLEEEEENKFNVLDLIWDRSDIRAGRRIRVGFLVLAMQQMMGRWCAHRSLLTLTLASHRNQSFRLLLRNYLRTSRVVLLSCITVVRSHEHSFRSWYLFLTFNDRTSWKAMGHAVFGHRPHFLSADLHDYG